MRGVTSRGETLCPLISYVNGFDQGSYRFDNSRSVHWNDQPDRTQNHDSGRPGVVTTSNQMAPLSMPRVEQFTICKRGSIFNRQVRREARAGKPLSDYYGLLESMLPFRFSRDFREITIPTLVLANEGDPFFGSQPEQAYELLDSVPRSRKSLVHLTAQKGASLHDQPVGPQVAEEAVFDWLDDQLS